MTRTLVRQSTQIRKSDVYDDTLVAGVVMESGAVSAEDDFNSLRSQITRLQGGSNWYDGLVGRSVELLGTDLSGIELKPVLFRSQILASIAVGVGDNFAVLSVASGAAPSQVSAVGAVSTEGAVVAFLAGFGAHGLASVTGPNALAPRNLVVIRNAATSDPIFSGGKLVYGLLQSESATNAVAFDDVAARVQISFVRENVAGTAFEAVPGGDLDGLSINYSYVLRVFFDNIPQDAFLGGAFVDQAAALVADLQTVIDAQGFVTVNSSNDTQIDFGASTFGWTFLTDSSGSTAFGYDFGFRSKIAGSENFDVQLVDTFRAFRVGNNNLNDTYFSIARGAGTDVDVSLQATNLLVNITNPAEFTNQVLIGTAGNHVSIGDGGLARVQSETTTDLLLSGSAELVLTDSYRAASTWGGNVNGVPLAVSSTEWSEFADLSLNGSLLGGILAAATVVNRVKSTAVVTAASIAANTDLQNGVNIDNTLATYDTATFVNNVEVYLNGQLMRGGANAAANNDVYPGTLDSSGEIRFEFALTLGDVITTIRYGAV